MFPVKAATRKGRAKAPAETQHAVGTRCRDTCRCPSLSQAHCSVCHVTFGGVSLFDDHRKAGECVEPASLGMVERDGIWRRPIDDADLERVRAFRRSGTAVDGRTGAGAGTTKHGAEVAR